VRDFLIPPASVQHARLRSSNERDRAALILRNANFGDGQKGMVAIGRGTILGVGSEAEVAHLIGPGTKLRDVRSGWLSPGFVDSHVHLDGMAMIRDGIDLRAIKDRTELKKRLAEAAERRAFGSWLWAFGASKSLIDSLSADRLDELVPGLPVWVSAADGHEAVLSRELLGLFRGSAKGAVVGTEGRLSGTQARAAWRLLEAPSRARIKPLLLRAMREIGALGYTTVHSLGVSMDLLKMLIDLENTGRLHTRCLLYLDADSQRVRKWVQAYTARLRNRTKRRDRFEPIQLLGDGGRLVKVVGLKLWLDGSLRARTAALTSNYADAPIKGALHHDDDDIASTLALADAAGLQLALHAIGDAAVAQVARVLRATKRPAGALPVRIEHAQIVSPSTLAALRGLPLVCAIQPLHERDDKSFARARLGDQRMSWAYRAASLAEVCTVTSGSDAPVSVSDPWQMWRYLAGGKRTDGGSSSEVMTAQAAFETLAVDTLAGRPLTVRVGAPADLILWSAKPTLDGPAPKPLLTIIDGETVQIDGSLPPPRVAPSVPRQ